MTSDRRNTLRNGAFATAGSALLFAGGGPKDSQSACTKATAMYSTISGVDTPFQKDGKTYRVNNNCARWRHRINEGRQA
jgi:hypothetical protein